MKALNSDYVPEPYTTILAELNQGMQKGEVITRHQIRALVKFCYMKQYNKTFNDLMQNLMKYAEDHGFTKHGGTLKATSHNGKVYLQRIDANLQKVAAIEQVKSFKNSALIKIV